MIKSKMKKKKIKEEDIIEAMKKGIELTDVGRKEFIPILMKIEESIEALLPEFENRYGQYLFYNEIGLSRSCIANLYRIYLVSKRTIKKNKEKAAL